MRRVILINGFAVWMAACSAPASQTPAPAPAAATGGAAVPDAVAPAAVPASSAAPPFSAAPAAAAPTAAPAAAPARPSATATRPSPASTPASSTPAPSPAAATPTAAAPAPSPAPPAAPAAPPAPEYREITVPAGARLSIELRTAHATDTSTVEERVRGVLRQPLIVDGVEVVPAGAAVSGAITETERAGKVKGRAHLALRFTSITVDDADLRVTTDRIARDAESTKKEDAAKIGIGAGAGAIVGAITGGKKGAAVGGAIGAGAGTGVVLATRGDEVRLDAGTVLSTTLREPLVVRQRVR